MNKLRYILLMLLGISLFSCVKDLGNYNYTDVPEFSISNIKNAYSIVAYTKPLVIEPVITSDAKDGEYEYLWTMYSNNLQNGVKIDTICTDSKLNQKIECNAGDYTLQVKITDKKTGISQFAYTSLEVVTSFSRGFYILKETADGNTEMDMFFDDNTSITNAIAEFNGAALNGKPKSLSYLNEFSYLNKETGVKDISSIIIPASQEELASFSLTDMSKLRSYNEWFYNEPSAESYKDFYFFMPNGFTYACAAKTALTNNSQCVQYGMKSSGLFPIDPDFAPDAKPYQLSNAIWPFNNGMLCFDQAGSRFLMYNYNGEIRNVDFSQSANNPGKFSDEFVFSGATIIGNDQYGVLLFKKADGGMYVYNCDMGSIENSFKANITSKVDVQASAQIKKANLIAINRYGAKYMYFIADNSIYAASYDNMNEQKLTFQGLPDGEITFLDTMFSLFGEGNNNPDKYNYLVIGVSNAGKYSVCFYNMVGGKPDGAPVKVLEGEGKVSRIQRTTPLRLSGSPYSPEYSKHF